MVDKTIVNGVYKLTRIYDRRKFRSQTSDNMDRWKSTGGKSQRREEKKKEDQKRESLRRKKIQREKVGKSRNTAFFSMICGSGGLKSRLAKAAGAEPAAGQMRNEKLHAVVARSTFRSQNVHNTPLSDDFWKLRCRKSARRCGAKHIWMSKCTKHTSSGLLFEVEMSKKCTLLWREAHFQVKMYKTHQRRTTFGRSDAVSRGSCAPCQKGAKRKGFVGFSTTTTTTTHYTTLQLQLHLHYIPLFYTTLHYTTFHYTTLHYTRSHYTTTAVRFTTLHSTTLHYTTLTLHYTTTTLHYIPLHYTTLHSTTLHYTSLNYTTLHYTTLHYTPLHYIQLHYTTLNDTALHLQLELQLQLHYIT